jgi:tetratricopeptide (TPR) repeat protein/two-component sensor histidine kinase
VYCFGTIAADSDIQPSCCFSSIFLRRDIKMIPSTTLDIFEWIKGRKETDIDEIDTAFLQWVVKSEQNEENSVEAYNHFIEQGSNRLNSNPDDLKALTYRSVAFFRSDRFDEGMIDFSRVVELSPQELDVYVERAKYYQRKNKYSEAIADFSKAIEINDTVLDFIFNRAKCHQECGHYLDAISDYSKAIDLSSAENRQYYTYRAQCYAELKMFDEALSDYTHSTEIKPNAEGYLGRGKLYIQMDEDKAIADCSKAIKLNHDYDEAYLVRGKLFENKCQYDLAEKDYTEAIKINPECADAYINRADLYHYHLSRYDDAIKDYYEAIPRGFCISSEMYGEIIEASIKSTEQCAEMESQLREKKVREDERKKIIADLSHSIKNLISTVIDPLENLKQETSVKPQVIENALRGANLIREIVNAVNLSFKGSIDDFRYDAAHNTDSDSQDIKTIITEAFKHSVGNMFDGKYFGTFMRNYFPEKSLYVAGKSEWSTLSQLGDLDRLRPFIEKYFFRTDFDLDHAEQFIIGNQKGSIIKLMILFQEMILNAVKYSAFIDRENRFLKIRFTASEQSVSILVENPFDRETKVKTSGIGHVIIENFAQLLGTTPEIKNDDAIYSVQIRFNNIWKETDK